MNSSRSENDGDRCVSDGVVIRWKGELRTHLTRIRVRLIPLAAWRFFRAPKICGSHTELEFELPRPSDNITSRQHVAPEVRGSSPWLAGILASQARRPSQRKGQEVTIWKGSYSKTDGH